MSLSRYHYTDDYLASFETGLPESTGLYLAADKYGTIDVVSIQLDEGELWANHGSWAQPLSECSGHAWKKVCDSKPVRSPPAE